MFLLHSYKDSSNIASHEATSSFRKLWDSSRVICPPCTGSNSHR